MNYIPVNNSSKRSAAGRLKSAYEYLNALTGGFPDLLVRAVQRFSETGAPDAAAGMAYYAVFSLFPLLLFVMSISSFVLESARVQQQVSIFVGQTFPASRGLIDENIQQVLELRGPVGLLSTLGLLWSASGFFNILAYHINRAWQKADVRSFVKRRLVALGIVGSLAGLLILSVIFTTTLDLLSQFRIPLWNNLRPYGSALWQIVTNALPFLIRLVIFLGLYRWVPNTHVTWTAALVGAVVAAVGWEVTTAAFTWYLGTGMVQYELVYGSLGAMVGLMFWIYLSSLIMLFGAHLSAVIGRRYVSQP